jgi:hypothetical protein
VAALLARGHSNRAIAEALVITETTAEVHVKHIWESSASSRARKQRSGPPSKAWRGRPIRARSLRVDIPTVPEPRGNRRDVWYLQSMPNASRVSVPVGLV